MTYKKLFAFISAITIFLIIGCNDSPSDLGVDFLSQDGVEVFKLDSSVDSVLQQSNHFKKVINLGSSDHLLLGKAENVTAKMLLRFVVLIPDTILTELKARSLTVIDSYIELTKDYSFGDSAALFDYKVFKINSSWSASTFTADSLSNLQYDNVDLSFNRVSANDTVYSFHVDTTLTSSWLQNYADSSVGSNYGILMEPTVNSQKVLGFTAFNISGIDDPRLRIVVQKPGEYIDTLIGYIAADISAVEGDVQNTVTENLYIQSSLTSEVKLFFDLSVLPSDCVVSSAKLTLAVDTIQTKTGSNFTNSLRVFLFSDSSKKEISTSYIYTLTRSGAAFTGDITNLVRAWKNNVDNQGMLIRASSELRGVEIFSVKGSNAANLSDRPKLEIIYGRKKY